MSRTRVLLITAAIAVSIGLVTTIAGGLLVRSGSWCDSTANPTMCYGEYGWPIEWRTKAPYRMIEATGADLGIWGYNREGFSFGRFATVTLFFAAPVVAVEVAGLGVWWAWRFSRSRRAHLPPAS